MNWNLNNILRAVASWIALAPGVNPHAAVERLLTVPKRERMALYAGMSDEDKAEAERLYREAVDKTADWAVYVASRGEIEAD